MTEPFSKSSFLGFWGWRGAINLAEWLGDRLGGSGAGVIGGRGKDGCLYVTGSGWIGARGNNSLLEDLKDLGPTRRAISGRVALGRDGGLSCGSRLTVTS